MTFYIPADRIVNISGDDTKPVKGLSEEFDPTDKEVVEEIARQSGTGINPDMLEKAGEIIDDTKNTTHNISIMGVGKQVEFFGKKYNPIPSILTAQSGNFIEDEGQKHLGLDEIQEKIGLKEYFNKLDGTAQ